MARKKSLLTGEAKAAIVNARQAAKDAKRQKQLAAAIYKAKAKEMRPYLKKLRKWDLRKNLSKYQKSLINAAWQEYSALTLRPTKVYRSKNKKKLEIAQKASQHTGKVKFDVAFVPTISQKARIKIRGDSMIVSSPYVDEIKIPFNMVALANDPKSEIERILKKYPEFSQFVLMAGEYIWNGPIDRSRVMEKVYNQLMKYAPGGSVYDNPNHKNHGENHHFLNWAFGLKGFRAKKQSAVNDYVREYHKAKNEKIKTRKSDKRKRGRTYGKKF